MSSLFWTEGSIEAIVLESTVCFQLSPSAAFLFSEAGNNQVLFIKVNSRDEAETAKVIQNSKKTPVSANARLVECSKDATGAKCIWFATKIKPTLATTLLMAAKTARSSVRVGIAESEVNGTGKGLNCEQPFIVSRLMFI